MDNEGFLNSLGLVDLISEKHKQLRARMMKRVELQFGNVFSQMDIYLISLVEYEAMSVSESARYMNISRQAAHKHVKHLVSLNFVDLTISESNRREKIVSLTSSGKELSQQINQIKSELDAELKDSLGDASFDKLKLLLKGDW
ncbi:winged helix DNA-binding protein [Ferrimonas lipolytica]|uniref:Winged helix DNA-binding protein n=1 Tax=Ferrimonas lipolytica TaxID=2724191 RepID=A0A6H1UCD8_9GAMM|nr:winged helix DNA-binding protein [Ferrimonas lipolytica]QIZ76508.1 winged helix DNA-binding protein [Ferrimonas lipolytica]